MKYILKCMVLTFVLSLYSVDASAQFWKKLERALENTEKALDRTNKALEKVLPSDSVQPNDSVQLEAQTCEDKDMIDSKDYLEQMPSYSVKKVILADSLGQVLKNEDGTVRYEYRLLDKEGKVCDREVAKKHLQSALKSGSFILLKVGATTAISLLSGKGNKLKRIAFGVGTGMLLSIPDIMKLQKQVSLMKDCNKVLEAYEKTFTEEGIPLDVAADLSNVDGIDFTSCGEVTKTSEEVKNELSKSLEESDSLEGINFDELIG